LELRKCQLEEVIGISLDWMRDGYFQDLDV
jgi:hypothetical protein